MVLGETQILGQVRSSYMLAQKEDTIGTVFNHLFKQALTVAKKAHSETEINTNAVSVSYAAVELAKKIYGELDNKSVLVIGAGMVGLAAMEAVAITARDVAVDSTTASVVGAGYGVVSIALGATLLAAGIAVVRAGTWQGWSRWVVLSLGVWVFFPMFPALATMTDGARGWRSPAGCCCSPPSARL